MKKLFGHQRLEAPSQQGASLQARVLLSRLSGFNAGVLLYECFASHKDLGLPNSGHSGDVYAVWGGVVGKMTEKELLAVLEDPSLRFPDISNI